MKQLTNAHKNLALDYAAAEPEYNLFIIGDIECYGLEGSHVSVYTADSWEGGSFPYIVLNYLGNFMVYSKDPRYDAESVGNFLTEQGAKEITGKADVLEKLLPWLSDMQVRQTHLSRLNKMSVPPQSESLIRRMGQEDAEDIYDLYMQIEELTGYRHKGREAAMESIRQNLNISGRTYGLYVTKGSEKRLVSIASTAAENSLSAMVIGVGTLKEYRKHGYASAVISRLCHDCLQDGKQFLCLFYDNPEAGKIYKGIGFQEVGLYTMIQKKQ